MPVEVTLPNVQYYFHEIESQSEIEFLNEGQLITLRPAHLGQLKHSYKMRIRYFHALK
jgi:hypothetical protein